MAGWVCDAAPPLCIHQRGTAHEGKDGTLYALPHLPRRRLEGGMVHQHGSQHLFGHMAAPQPGQPHSTPVGRTLRHASAPRIPGLHLSGSCVDGEVHTQVTNGLLRWREVRTACRAHPIWPQGLLLLPKQPALGLAQVDLCIGGQTKVLHRA